MEFIWKLREYNMIKFINLTPHTITLNNGINFPSIGKVAKVSTTTVIDNIINNIPIYSIIYGKLENLPDPTDGIIYIVSNIVLEAGKKIRRTDLVAPATNHSDTIRNENGQIISVPGFVK